MTDCVLASSSFYHFTFIVKHFVTICVVYRVGRLKSATPAESEKMRSVCLDNSLICRYLGHIQFVSTCERPDLDLTVSEFMGFFPEYIFNLQLQSVPSERNYNSQFGFSNTQCHSSLSALMAPII